MKIYVNSIEVETKDIIKIEEAGCRMHGFIIHLINNKVIPITQPQKYDMSNSDCAAINDRYRRLRGKVEAEWNKDKINHIVLDF